VPTDESGVGKVRTHALTLKAEPPVGRLPTGDDAERYEPNVRLNAPSAALRSFVAKRTPDGCATTERAATLSACEPDRKKAVSGGPAVRLEAGRQPSVVETKVEFGGQDEQKVDAP